MRPPLIAGDAEVSTRVAITATGVKGASGDPVLEIDVDDLLGDLVLRVRDDNEGVSDVT